MTPKKAPKETKGNEKAKEAKDQTTPTPDATQATDGFLVVRQGVAPKANGRGITYQVGRKKEGDGGQRPAFRLVGNDGGGTFSKEWVTLDAVRAALPQGDPREEPFRPVRLAAAFVGKSKNNPGFLACALVGEGLVARVPEKDGWLAVASDWECFERAVVDAKPLPAGTFTEVKPPEKRKVAPKKGKKAETTEGSSNEGSDGEEPGPEGTTSEEPDGGQETEAVPLGEPEKRRARGKAHAAETNDDSGEIPVTSSEETDDSAEVDPDAVESPSS